ncbi:hypothetical protein ACMV5L_01695 [Serratia plymuthica]|uniref:hypothetical protein n=1 Tax=Serratia plymuthica TaxID=82996 RepID=UPI003DA63565
MTQAVVEYLGLFDELDLDGISFESMQVNDVDNANIVLFSKYSKVENSDSSKKSGYDASLPEYEEGNDEVYELFTPVIRKIIKEPSPHTLNSRHMVVNKSKLVLTLDVENIMVNYVKGIRFSVDEHPVSLGRDTESQDYYSADDDDQEF